MSKTTGPIALSSRAQSRDLNRSLRDVATPLRSAQHDIMLAKLHFDTPSDAHYRDSEKPQIFTDETDLSTLLLDDTDLSTL